MKTLTFAGLILLAGTHSLLAAKHDPFANWPEGKSSREMDKRVAERFAASGHLTTIINPETCAWDGALTFAQLSTDKDLRLRLIGRFDPLLAPEGSKRIPRSRNVDNSVFGAVPLGIYMQTKDTRYLKLGRMIADRQSEMPTQQGLTRETHFWIDDMFMITAVQIQAYRGTGAAKYLDRAALEMTVYLDKLQQPNGLFSTHPTPPLLGPRRRLGCGGA